MGDFNILVVEDERITAKDIKKSLEKVGYNVPAMVTTGEDAVKFCEENKPDLVLMDIKLEGEVDGIEAAETIISKFSVPIIYLTSYSDKGTVERAKTTHPSAFILKEPFGFLHKPFEENELYAAIDIILYRNCEESQLKSHDKLLASVLKTISDGVISTDPEGRVKFMNDSADKLTGIQGDDYKGRNVLEIFPTLKLETDISKEHDLQDFVKGDIKINKNTSVEGTITPIKDDKGNNDGVVIIFRKS